MIFDFDNKKFDTDDLSKKGKLIFKKLENIYSKKNELKNQLSDIEIIEKFYTDALKVELPKEEEKVTEIISQQ